MAHGVAGRAGEKQRKMHCSMKLVLGAQVHEASIHRAACLIVLGCEIVLLWRLETEKFLLSRHYARIFFLDFYIKDPFAALISFSGSNATPFLKTATGSVATEIFFVTSPAAMTKSAK